MKTYIPLLLTLALGFVQRAAAQEFHPPADALVRPTVLAGEPDPGGRFFGRTPDPTRTRHYYIAAEPGIWNFVPTGEDPVTINPVPPLVKDQVVKFRYIEYTDATFRAQVLRDERLGILGPVLRGVTGEFLVVTFLNRTDRPLSMHPHGLRYDKDSEGASYFPDRGKGAAVAPGARFTYVWHIDEAASPGPNEPSSKAWLYHSHVQSDVEINLGLVGAIYS